jgi:hypothetical protein
MQQSKLTKPCFSIRWSLALLVAGCATPAAPTSPQEAYNQAVQQCEQTRNASLGQPPSAVQAAFDTCMAQAAPLSR